MSKTLVIVESPAKAKTIQKYLSKIQPNVQFVVEASYGHIRDLEKKKMGIDLSSFQTSYTLDANKQETIQKLVQLAKSSKFVYLASDNDREGESIAWHLREVLDLKKKQYARIVFNEITEKALSDALAHPHDIDQELVDAQQTRRMIDRIMGFKLSPLLWSTFKTENGGILSAGRVQSAVLNLIIDKERHIQDHEPEPYWTIESMFALPVKLKTEEGDLLCKLYDNKSGNIAHFDSLTKTKQLMAKMDSKYEVINKTLKNSKESPDAPFITSTLQQDAYNKIGLSVKSTMQVAQKLYEAGHITYMRTDSYNLSQDAMKDIKKEVVSSYGTEMYEERDYTKSKRVRNSQQAHEAIRPTRLSKKPESIKDPIQRKLYDLIYKRTIASQMKQCVFKVLDLTVSNNHLKKLSGSPYHFKGKVSILSEPGWRSVYGEKAGAVETLQKLHDTIDHVKSTKLEGLNGWTSAPGRFNESSIVKLLEKEGIGRPSTYAGILDKLYQKSYLVVQDSQGTEIESVHLSKTNDSSSVKETKSTSVINVEKARLYPTDVGIEVNQYLEEHFGDLIDSEFTSQMEEQLDEIAEGKKQWKQVLKMFWSRLQPRVEAAMIEAKKADKVLLATEKKEFNVGGQSYIVRLGRFGPLVENTNIKKGEPGKFLSLKSYLKLTKKPYTDIDANDVHLLTSLPKDISGSKGVLRYGRFGFYLSIGEETYLIPQGWVYKKYESWSNIGKMTSHDVEELVKMKKEYLIKKKSTGKEAPGGTSKTTTAVTVKQRPKKNKDKYDPVKRKLMKAAKIVAKKK